jgi:hypothetical protein
MPRLRPFPVFLAAAVCAVALYLLAARLGGFTGFPLDDAWIHQTYARNLAALGQFAFEPGRPSAGSTSPLWTLLLAAGYLLRVEYHAWAFALGAALLTLNGWLAYRLVLDEWPDRPAAALLAGLFVTLEWHLVWAAASGMETLLFSAFALGVFVIERERPALVGVCVGLSILARPDGLTLLPFALARVALAGPNRLRAALSASGAFALVFVPYLAFNYWLSGSIWPNTFYAKQAEYAALRAAPLLDRLLRVGLQPFVGASMLLVPGLVSAVIRWGRDKRWGALLPLGWGAAFLAAYALRLPVIYQHGRYLMPVLPALSAVGVGGLSDLLQLRAPGRPARVGSRIWAAAAAALLMAFLGLGAQAYMRDVQIIETEMVATAEWVNANTPPGALIAAHDIGALGYFGRRPILDLAGLVSPEVIPFIRDEARLQVWLRDAGANYLVTFPGWYPALTGPLGGAQVYTTAAVFSPAAGGENMTVYRLPGR